MKFLNTMSAKFLLVALLGLGICGQIAYAAAGEQSEVSQDIVLADANNQAQALLARMTQQGETQATSWMKSMKSLAGEAGRQAQDLANKLVKWGRDKAGEVVGAVTAGYQRASAIAQEKFEGIKTQLTERMNQFKLQAEKAQGQIKNLLDTIRELKAQLKTKYDEGVAAAQKQWETTKTTLEAAKQKAEEQLAPFKEKATQFGTMVVTVGTSLDAIDTAAEKASEAKASLDQQLKILKRTGKLSPEEKKEALKKIVEDSNIIGEFVALLDDKFIANLSALMSDSEKEGEPKKEGEPGRLESIRAGLASYLNTLEVIKYLVGDEELLVLKQTEVAKPGEFKKELDVERAAELKAIEEKQGERKASMQEELLQKERENREKEEAATKIQRAFRASRPESAPEKPAGRPEETAQERLASQQSVAENVTPEKVIEQAEVNLPELQGMLAQAVVK